jgi:hypothetical protein
MNIISAIRSPKLFKPVFRDLESWSSWMTVLKCLFGLPLDDQDACLYRLCTGREAVPGGEFKELAIIAGRRSGKSFIAALIAVYLGLFDDYRKFLGPGERGSIVIVAADRLQARVIFNYCYGILHGNPVFQQNVLSTTRDRIELSTQVDIEILTCNFRTIRGRTIVCALCDEIAFWMDEGRNPDHEVVTGIRPATATIPNAKIVMLSSPYARRGVLWEMYQRCYGKPDEGTLVWQAPTRTMNPLIPEDLIAKETEKDPIAAASEWGAAFRADIQSFLPLEWIERAVVTGRYELPPARFAYSAFADPSGGAQDAFTLSIAHREGETIVQDVLRAEKPPFDPYRVVSDFSQLLREYGCSVVTGDKYAGAWVSEAFQKHGIRYEPSPRSKSELYLEFEPLLARGQVELLDNKALFAELRGLERRTGRGRRDAVDHPPNGHDDAANATAGVMNRLDTTSRLFQNLERCLVGDGYDGEILSNLSQ